MNRRDYLKYGGALASVPLVAGHGAAANGAENGDGVESDELSPRDLRVDYERTPNNLSPSAEAREADVSPRFAWDVTGPRGVRQSAYRILVSSSRDALENEDGDVWDSGTVESSRSVNVLYEGESLEPDATYYWTVRVRDADGTDSGWSDPSYFVTALPDDDDHWEGEWIGIDYGDAPEVGDDEVEGELPVGEDYLENFDRYDDRPEPLLRREFDVGKEIEEARVHISGLGYNELHLNGERVGDRVLDPALTDFEETVLYSTYDVTEHLQQGANAIGVSLGRGRFGEMVGDNGGWGWTFAPWWSDPQLLVQLNVEFSDGTSTSIVTDDSWTMTDGPTRFDSLFSGEVYDAREEKPGWTSTDYDDSDWETPNVVDAPEGELVPQRLQPIKVTGTIEPVEITEPEDGVYVFDVGQMIAGWTELTVEGPEGTAVTLTHGEKLNDDGTVDNSNFLVDAPMQRDRYILKGDGQETWESRYSYKGYRYVQVEGFPGEPTLDSITAEVVHSAIDENVESDFSSSNELLDQIHENTRWAYLNNMHGYPEDTPTYEKNGWTGDAQLTAETGMYNFDMPRFWRKWLRDYQDAQLDDGELPTIVPTPGYSYLDREPNWEAVQGPTPGWDFAYFHIPWQMYRHYGDTRILETHYDGLKLYIDWLQSYVEENTDAEGHIIPVGLGDWGGAPLSDESEGPAITSTAYYFRMTEILTGIATLLGRGDEAAEWAALSEEIREDFNDEFLDREHGLYRTGEFESDGPVNETAYYQVDFVEGEPIEELTDDESGDYSLQNRAIRFLHGNSKEPVTRTGAPTHTLADDVSACVDVDGIEVERGEATVEFTVEEGCEQRLSLASYEKIGPGWSRERQPTQEFHDAETDTFGPGTHTLTVPVPGEEYRQTSNVFPLAFDLVPDEYEDAVVENLVENVMVTHDGHLNTATLGTKYLLPVLTEHGHHDVAYTVATQTDYPSWGHWIVNGMTALLEFWDLDARSRDHHFLGSIDEWFYEYLAGIRIGEPGFEHVEIAPEPVGDLDRASGRVDTVRGPVESHWELTDTNGITLNVTIPGNATATVAIPTLGGERVRVREGGKTIWNDGNRTRPNHGGIEAIDRDGDATVVDVGSGEYSFQLDRLGDE